MEELSKNKDGLVQLHYLPTFKLFSHLKKSKGCHLFAVNETVDSVIISCAFRKKILLYRLERGHFSIIRELNVGEPARYDNTSKEAPNSLYGLKFTGQWTGVVLTCVLV